jgi:thioredoxin reductase (NADPH)
MIGHGLTSCATCDGAFYRNVPVCVVGGGDSAAEEATFLTRFASKVYLIHRRDTLRASKIMAERALSNPKIEPIWNTVLTAYLTDDQGEMRAVKIRDVNGDAERELEVKCVFVAIGHTPNTAAYKGHLGHGRKRLPSPAAWPQVESLAPRQKFRVSSPRATSLTTSTVRPSPPRAKGCAAALDAERYLANSGEHH